ncbi:MAG: DUF2087 domain-containing protein [Chlorobi bacterium]|nr:MAG: hypothetical protein UZ07_CHB004001753 [Chlorobi bacterium OLB7]MBK8911243.1 DUF2087 domain-containing protein [Chlorobiota bacterium]MBX7217995.1 DUF2087 domain-containing protein [Candidatus Kapabacteria bacterium]
MEPDNNGELEGLRQELYTFLDEHDRLWIWPARPAKRNAALRYLATKFEAGKEYTEREVNQLLQAWHTFGDHALLRRELYDAKLIERTRNGAVYWRTPNVSE